MNINIEDYKDLVVGHAWRLLKRLPPSVTIDDLIAAGNEGLWQASLRYKEDSGTPFTAFAQKRVRGSMIDYLRTLYVVGKMPTEELPADAFNKYNHTYNYNVDVRDLLLAEMNALPDHLKDVLFRVYFQDESAVDIAKERKVTKGAIGIQKRNALKKLRESFALQGIEFKDIIQVN